MQRGATADRQRAALGVDVVELAPAVGVQLDGVRGGQAPRPRLGVVDARCAASHADELAGHLHGRGSHGLMVTCTRWALTETADPSRVDPGPGTDMGRSPRAVVSWETFARISALRRVGAPSPRPRAWGRTPPRGERATGRARRAGAGPPHRRRR